MNANYVVEGAAADGQTYVCSGPAEGEEIMELLHNSMRAAFQQLTSGKAVYGKPGVGCRGPYKISRVEITVAEKSP